MAVGYRAALPAHDLEFYIYLHLSMKRSPPCGGLHWLGCGSWTVPDDGEGIGIILAWRRSEIGVDAAGELRGINHQRDIGVTR